MTGLPNNGQKTTPKLQGKEFGFGGARQSPGP